MVARLFRPTSGLEKNKIRVYGLRIAVLLCYVIRVVLVSLCGENIQLLKLINVDYSIFTPGR